MEVSSDKNYLGNDLYLRRGLAVGTLINESGAAERIGELVSGMGLTGGLTTVFVIVTVTLLMSDVTSNTATAAVAIPIVISIVKGMD